MPEDVSLALRPGSEADMPAILDLWVEAWATVMPDIDFVARRSWYADRQRTLVAEGAVVTLAEREGALVGFTLLNLASGYLDQIAVRPSEQGRGVAQILLDDARRRCPSGLSLHVNQRNPRAIRFYEREGFVRTGEGVNPNSGQPIFFYAWSDGAPLSPN
jgi:putative acetyltransferase